MTEGDKVRYRQQDAPIVPDYYARAMREIGGVRLDGRPKWRLVYAPSAKFVHGTSAGHFKYIDPRTDKPKECWVIEQAMPQELLGSRDNWQYEMLGPYPYDCSCDHCDNTYWGWRMDVSVNGEYLPLTEHVLHFIRTKAWFDVEFGTLSQEERMKVMDDAHAKNEVRKDEKTLKQFFDIVESYATHKQTLDNADNRVQVGFGKATLPDTIKGGKEAIGTPQII